MKCLPIGFIIGILLGICFILTGYNSSEEYPIYTTGNITISASSKVIFFENNIDENLVENKKIALTFDDGPIDVAYGTGYLLDGLKERNVEATFFIMGSGVEKNPDLTRRMYEEGHLLGNHSYNHVNLTQVSVETLQSELEETCKIVKYLTGEDMAYMRPPYGAWDKSLEIYTNMLPVMWTLDPRDWDTKNTSAIVEKVVTTAKENDIILLHDGYKTSADAAFQIIDILQEKGFEFVTVDEILHN